MTNLERSVALARGKAKRDHLDDLEQTVYEDRRLAAEERQQFQRNKLVTARRAERRRDMVLAFSLMLTLVALWRMPALASLPLVLAWLTLSERLLTRGRS